MGIAVPGRRVELLSMDPHFHDITVALYWRPGAANYLVHSFSGLSGAEGRVAGIAAAMRGLGGMEPGGEPGAVRFSCGEPHTLAARRLFIEACKIAPGAAVEPRPMQAADKKSGQTIRAASLGGGRYRVSSDGADKRRVLAVARGLTRLAEMRAADGADNEVEFACGRAHDPLIGLLMVRALNLRAVMREIEMQAARGVLAAPSAQN